MELTTAEIEEPLCLFLVGLQCRSWKSLWKIPFITIRVSRMYKELQTNKDSGLLWGKFFTSKRPFTTLILTYWKSSEHIHRFVSDPKYSHIKSTIEYYQKFNRDPHIGVWHETYEITPNHAETMYYGMEPFGASAFLQTKVLKKNAKGYMKRLRGQS